ncbi:hypothetical protein GIB67_009564 [Kingdonia uniflora]|uniref:S-protein homolog n=1 Tax=Kingdonia uniflora TaxID=39325 RepID=A0A7J7NWD4_9MAGN|nr:hypothetical protein GIB67_009564 [Kingdonia uniflora]
MLTFTVVLIFFSQFFEFALVSPSISPPQTSKHSIKQTPEEDPFINLLIAFRKWDFQVGCKSFKETHKVGFNNSSSLQDGVDSRVMKMDFVSVLVKGWTWVPDNLDNLYSCRCGLNCLWSKSSILADKPDVLLFETTTPPAQVLCA